MNLIIDQGNTLYKVYVFSERGDIVYKFKHNDAKIIQKTAQLLIEQYKIKKSIYSTVSRTNFELAELLDLRTDYIFFNYKTPLPIKNLYNSPETLGVDRLAAAVGANYLYPRNEVLICDIGTAITFDIINSQAEYLGGNISAGPHLRLKALHEFTAKLPEVELNEPVNTIGKTTPQAILNGAVWGIVYEIEGYIENLSQNFKNLRTILTGGYSYFFGKKMKSPIFVEIYLVPIGLNRILEFNK